MAPAPRSRIPKGKVVADSRKASEQPVIDGDVDTSANGSAPRKLSLPETSSQFKPSFAIRRRSSGNKGTMGPISNEDGDVYEHLRHLGPSNAANRPKATRINTVKIKPAAAPSIPNTIPEHKKAEIERPPSRSVVAEPSHAPEGGIGEGLLTSAGLEASDGVHTLALGYGTMAPSGDRTSWKSGKSGHRAADDDDLLSPKAPANGHEGNTYIVVDNTKKDHDSKARSRSASTIASLRSKGSRSGSPPQKRHTARSGSISENVVHVGGIKKIVLETTSSSDSEDKKENDPADDADEQKHSDGESTNAGSQNANKKRRKKRGKKKKGNAGESHETQPLLGGDD